MEPFFSIIIPTYNRASLIGKAINSVLQQSFADWELLVIDDGSTDNTKAVMGTYADSRIKYIYQQNAERCAARNNGILQSKGKYITFLDSDDYYLPQRLQLLHKELEGKGMLDGFFYTGLQLADIDTGKAEDKDVAVLSTNKYDNVALSMIHSQQVCASRNVFSTHLYNVNLSIGEDMELWLRIAKDYDLQPVKQQCTVVVVEHSERSINVKNANPFIKQMETYAVMFANGHAGNSISEEVKNALYANAYFGFAKYHIYKHEKMNGVYWLWKSINAKRNHPQNRYKLNLIRYLLFNPAKAVKLLHN